MTPVTEPIQPIDEVDSPKEPVPLRKEQGMDAEEVKPLEKVKTELPHEFVVPYARVLGKL